MKKLILKFSKLFLVILLLTFFSCSKDDDVQKCMETNVVMTINGDEQSFQALGRGISLRPEGYELSLSFYRSTDNPLKEQNIVLILPYKKTGKNIIQHIYYSEYMNGEFFEGDFVNDELQMNVIKNTALCFYATFSGVLMKEGEEIVIENGIISYLYEDSFDD